MHTADLATEVRRASDFGIDAELTGLDWRSIRDRTFSKIDRISAAGRQFRVESDRVTLFEGRARFAGPHELVIDGETRIRADRIVLATGKLLGAHILGYQASLLIQPLVQAMSTGQSVASMARGQYWIHPALSEVVENALLKLPAQWTGS